MAGLPGSTPSLIPPGQDETQRRLRDLERRMDEMGPSIARSFTPVLDALILPETQWSTESFGFALTTTPTTVSTVTFTIPDGYTRAVFVYNGICWGTNHSGVAASITLAPSAVSGTISQLYGGHGGPTLPDSTDVVTTMSVSDVMTGLVPGQPLYFETDAFVSVSGFGSDNQINVGVLVLWMH